ncbi:hypothetical protein GALMADRAFT_132354 [Galerina marginata CBS 339.88]|uniref:Copper homeostasis protein cutC homolog n=1 Tax=Galerina marginata (strain CBS 339.88) TaxID=685588 RepID=A0A067TR75_GALM3|nr:hypothetical protein GALMADRAFT_132354 [Galerina marginata CBS 339.88]
MSLANIYLEVCVGTAELAEAALKGGAAAIEICQLTADGGITPDISLVDSISRLVMQRNNCPIVTIRIRPRTGNFVYSDKEFQTMLNDIVVFKESDCVQGFSLAVLTESGSVDVDRMNM